MSKFYKLEKKGKLFGVCAGLADKFDINVTLLRTITFILSLFSSTVIIIYFLLALLLPDKNRRNN